MLDDKNSDHGKVAHQHDLSITALAFIALMFFLIAGVNAYMQDSRDIANGNAAMVEIPSSPAVAVGD